jgi:hypothetical protein
MGLPSAEDSVTFLRSPPDRFRWTAYVRLAPLPRLSYRLAIRDSSSLLLLLYKYYSSVSIYPRVDPKLNDASNVRGTLTPLVPLMNCVGTPPLISAQDSSILYPFGVTQVFTEFCKTVPRFLSVIRSNMLIQRNSTSNMFPCYQDPCEP